MRFTTLATIDPRVTTFIIIAALILLALAMAPIRRWLHGTTLMVQGAMDALVMANRPPALVVDTLGGKTRLLKIRTEATFNNWFRRWLKRSGRIFEKCNDASLVEANAIRVLADAYEARGLAAEQPQHNDRFQPIPYRVWLLLSTFVAVGDVVFTLAAFELWNLPIILLAPIVLLLGIAGVVIGHFAGHAIYARERVQTSIILLLGAVYSVVLGAMRYTYMSHQNHDSVLGNALGAYGVIVVLVGVSTMLSVHYPYVSSVEKAELALGRAKRWKEALFQRGLLLTKALNAKIEEERNHAVVLMHAYQRGFNLLWRKDPPECPDTPIDMQVDIFWPPSPLPEAAPSQNTKRPYRIPQQAR